MDSVKRDYRSALRAGQARQTRRTVIAAATAVFIEHGYAGATIDAVAATAGVSRKTVFTAVGGKTELLKTALDWAITGDGEEASLAERADLSAALAESDPARLLEGWVNVLVDVDIRVAPLFRALEIAADSDEAAAALRAQFEHQRLEGARTIVARLNEMGVLTNRVRRADAIDIAWLAGDPALFDRLVGSRGWSHRRYRSWLTELTAGQLLQVR